MPQKGKFIVLEGVDGSGISTQSRLLSLWFEKNKEIYGKTCFTKEPTEGPIGCLLRLVLTKRLKPLDEKAMALLFAADRVDHLYAAGDEEQREGVLSLLDKGINVVSDRYNLSSLSYQSRKVDLKWLRQINSFAIKPDLTILLMIPVQDSVERRSKSRFQEEFYEREDYLQEIRRNYERIAHLLQTEGENIVLIDARGDIETVFQEVCAAVMQLFTE